MKKVAVVGRAFLDVLVKSSGLKVMKSHQVQGGIALAEVYGGKSEAEEVVMETGGAGTNVAVGLSRLGMITTSIICLGDDFVKERINAQMSVEGVDTSMFQVSEKKKSGISVVLIAPDGGRSILTYSGGNEELSAKKIDWDKLSNSSWIHLSSVNGAMNLIDDLISFSKLKKIGISWNPGKKELEKRERVLQLLPKIDLLILNTMEATSLLHHNYDQVKESAAKLVELGSRMVAITDGKKGAGIGDESGFLWGPAFRVKSVDDTGAGDAFCAGVISGLLEGRDKREVLAMGLANGASQVMMVGAKQGLLRKEEMKKWLKRRVKFLEEVW